MVAGASDVNATADYESRRRLTKTELVGTLQAAAEQVDVDSLEFAIKEGICEPLNLNVPIRDDRFYEGVATQPGHVAAGLVVPRPTVMGKILSGLDERSAVVITGPSGVGKSAVLWMVPEALPGVLWYRVKRLWSEDVPHLMRLVRAQRPSPDAPVGLLVDGAGTEGFSGWSRLRADLESEPGVVVLATAREEDLTTLGDLTGCVTVTVQLYEAAAETIYRGLRRRGATQTPHWIESFSLSNRLTLEFTHLLTRGQRLGDVIGQQIQRRLDEERDQELELLRLVSVAHRWSATLSTSDVKAACGMSDWDLQRTLTRLAEEHLIVERDGMVSGLHRLRSSAISESIHTQPPHDLNNTITEVLPLVQDQQLHRFVANLLRDVPSARATVIQTATRASTHLGRLTAYLEGLRLIDFHEVAKTWKNIADHHEIWASTGHLPGRRRRAGERPHRGGHGPSRRRTNAYLGNHQTDQRTIRHGLHRTIRPVPPTSRKRCHRKRRNPQDGPCEPVRQVQSQHPPATTGLDDGTNGRQRRHGHQVPERPPLPRNRVRWSPPQHIRSDHHPTTTPVTRRPLIGRLSWSHLVGGCLAVTLPGPYRL